MSAFMYDIVYYLIYTANIDAQGFNLKSKKSDLRQLL